MMLPPEFILFIAINGKNDVRGKRIRSVVEKLARNNQNILSWNRRLSVFDDKCVVATKNLQQIDWLVEHVKREIRRC